VVVVSSKTGSDDGELELYSYDGSPGFGSRPTLYLEYYVGSAPAEEETTTGLRFQSLNIPRNVDITEAYIEFTSDRDQSGAFDFAIQAEITGDADGYTDTDNDISRTTRTRNSNVALWSVDAADSVSSGEVFRTPDISDLVEDVVKLDGWCGENDMGFFIKGTNGFRSSWSHDGDPSLAPRLVVRYDYDSIPSDGTTCYRDSVTQRIARSSDDVEEDGSSISLNGNVLNLESGNLIGLRFSGLNIPADATISRAYIELTERADQDSRNTTINIAIENSIDAETFTNSDGTVDGRSYIGTTKDWAITETWYRNNVYESPELKDLLKEVIKGSWKPGNAVAFKLTTTGSRDRRAYTNNSSPGQAARLVVEFQSTSGGSSGRKVRDELLTVVDNLSHNGWTPVQDTLYEAARYYKGMDVLWGAKRGGPQDGGPHAYTRVSSNAALKPNSFSNNYPSGCSPDDLSDDDCEDETLEGSPVYVSPIDNVCQKTSHIVLLTDGFANRDHSTTAVTSMAGSCTDAGTGDGGRCVKDLAQYLNTNNQSPLSGDQIIKTHTIGFQFASQWLKDVAEVYGGGTHASVSNSQQLVDAINAIIIDALKVDSTFVAPVAAVNQFNRLNNLSDIYFAVFRPDEVPAWSGNLKKYGLDENNVIVDKGGSPAVDPLEGFFKKGAIDLYNYTDESLDENDDNKEDVESGGAASNIPAYADRKVYTFNESASVNLPANLIPLNEASIDAGDVTQDMFATALNDTEFKSLVEWVRGRDTESDGDRYAFNDPLHSRPVAVTYNVSESNPDIEIYVGTNGGGVHAINAKTGVEDFIFFPEGTLPMQNALKQNDTTTPHLYGVDGSIVPWVSDSGANGIDAGSGDFVRLFFGMRRGGGTGDGNTIENNNYYSLDVTTRTSPKFVWKIEGGAGDYAEMGQTWATPIRGKIRLKDESPRDVLFISGGYDPIGDEKTVRTEDSAGRAVYIVDANTGALIWSGGPSADSFTKEFVDMKYSIPSSLTVADVDSDGLDDVMFVGDTGGQVWRFDLFSGRVVADLVKGGVIADVGVAEGDNTEARNRRFFHSPDVALVKRDGVLELAVTIGSGLRPSPLSRVTQDKFFMVRQLAVFGAPSSYTKIKMANLYDATDNRVGDGIDSDGNEVNKVEAREELEAEDGWYIDLHAIAAPGEKVLSTPLSLDGTVTFVTYTPTTAATECTAVPGSSTVYNVNIADATPTTAFTDLGEVPDETNRAFKLTSPSIIDEPVVICTGAGCDVFTGAEQPPLDDILNDRITRTYWRKDE